jgi:hypothetical protein
LEYLNFDESEITEENNETPVKITRKMLLAQNNCDRGLHVIPISQHHVHS